MLCSDSYFIKSVIDNVENLPIILTKEEYAMLAESSLETTITYTYFKETDDFISWLFSSQ
ncbi:hypothetical protein CHUAL_002195 [Chamberlinius hualienensis]